MDHPSSRSPGSSASCGPASGRSSSSSEENAISFEIGLEEESHFLPTDLLLDSDLILSGGRRGSADSSDKSGSEDEKSSRARPSPIRPPSRQKVRHTESLLQIRHRDSTLANPEDPNSAVGYHQSQHFQLRKTFSWASPPTSCSAEYSYPLGPLDSAASFSLFPKTSQSDLLSSVRNNLVLVGPQQQQQPQLLLSQQQQLLLPEFLNNNNSNNNKSIRTTDLEEALKNLSVENNETASLSRKF